MEPLRLGLIGCGVIGSGAHAPAAAASPLIDLVAVADLIEERRDRVAAQHGVGTAYASGEELLQDERLEAVVLALPTGVRTPLAYSALRRGLHVLLEKPVAMDAEQVREMVRLRGDRQVGVCSARYVLPPSARAAAECVASGALGKLRIIRSRAVLPAGPPPREEPPPWRVSNALNGGGYLVNWGCYDLDYVMAIAGWQAQPALVLAQTWRVADHLHGRVAPGSDGDNHFIALIRCVSGEVISFERGEFTSGGLDQAWQIMGDKGSLALWLLPSQTKQLRLETTDDATGLHSEVVWEGDDRGFDVTRALQEDLAVAVRENRPCQTSLERALIMQQITDAIYESAATGQAVALA